MALQWRNSETQYGLVARILHWSSVVFLVAVVYTSGSLEGVKLGLEKNSIIAEHSSFGVLLLFIMVIRFIWRRGNKNPIHSYTISLLQRRMALYLHRSIYAVLLFQCLLGLLILLTNSESVTLFYVFELPLIMMGNRELHSALIYWHDLLLIGVYFLFFIHVSAAIFHQIFGVIIQD